MHALVDYPRPVGALGRQWVPASPAPTYRPHSTNRRAHAAPRPRQYPRALGLVIALVVVLGVLLSPPARLAGTTLLILSELFPGAPARPLQWVSAPPRHEALAYRSEAGPVESDLYFPTGDGPHGALVGHVDGW